MKKIVSFWIVFLLTIVSAEAAKQPRKFYVTQDLFTGSQVLTACAEGYHMASLWEILDVSNLRYDTTLGGTRDDSGSGPPSGIGGWIRTGYSTSGQSQVPGIDNCFAWISDSSEDFGTVASLNTNLNSAPTYIVDPWISFTVHCDTPRPAWCVQD